MLIEILCKQHSCLSFALKFKTGKKLSRGTECGQADTRLHGAEQQPEAADSEERRGTRMLSEIHAGPTETA